MTFMRRWDPTTAANAPWPHSTICRTRSQDGLLLASVTMCAVTGVACDRSNIARPDIQFDS
jgi:hypothetical protein